MANILPDRSPDPDQKFALMQQDARFDIATSLEAPSPGLDAIRWQIRSRKALPRVPKIFLSNQCSFNCAYCGCRSGNDCKQIYTTTPRELAEFSMKTAAASGLGIFLSSAVFRSADYTAQLINETLRLLREEHGYGGFLHAKVMPGTDPALIRQAGRYADRLSVNIEVARSEGYARVARNKNRDNILTPMGQISSLIREAREQRGRGAHFATSQTTQLMVGSTEEDDSTILNLSGALYRKYGLSRVYYTPFDFRRPAAGYENLPLTRTPDWRVGRLYQADRLLAEYGFTPQELAPATAPNLRQDLDPKAAWALRNRHLFPIEVNTAGYEQLLRIPGIGTVCARRILEARRTCTITHDVLRRLGVSLKRSQHFLTCSGKCTGYSGSNTDLLYRLLCDLPEAHAGEQLYFDLGGTDRPWTLRPMHA